MFPSGSRRSRIRRLRSSCSGPWSGCRRRHPVLVDLAEHPLSRGVTRGRSRSPLAATLDDESRYRLLVRAGLHHGAAPGGRMPHLGPNRNDPAVLHRPRLIRHERRARGILVGLATAFKIYPVVFIIMWLWRRQFREAVTALVTAAVTTAISWILWPGSFSTFVRVLIIGHEEFGRFANGGAATYASSSVTSFFMRAPFHIGLLNWAWDGVFSVLVIMLGLCASQRLWKMDCEIWAMVCVLYASVLGSPVAWDHYFAFAPLLVLVIREVGLHSWLGRASVLALANFCVPWLFFHNSLETSAFLAMRDFVARNAIFLTSFLVLASVFATSRQSVQQRFAHVERWRRRVLR